MQKYFQYYNKIREKYNKVTEGRHGFDSMCRDILILWVILGFINGFVRSRIFSLVSLLCPVFAIWRTFSTNDVKRSIENRKYLEYRKKAFEFFKLMYKRIKEFKTHRYYTCKNCSAVIRVKRVKGEHTVACPKCRKEFSVRIH